MRLFWRHGYEGASVQALTQAMGVTPPSLYAAFGDKKQLFLEALTRYLSGPVTSAQIMNEAGTARDVAAALLHASANGFTAPDCPSGCLLATSAVTGSVASADVQQHVSSLRRDIEGQLRSRIEQAVHSGELAASTDADALAGHLMAVVQGMSTLARDGATRDKLMRVAEVAMKAWPAEPRRSA